MFFVFNVSMISRRIFQSIHSPTTSLWWYFFLILVYSSPQFFWIWWSYFVFFKNFFTFFCTISIFMSPMVSPIWFLACSQTLYKIDTFCSAFGCVGYDSFHKVQWFVILHFVLNNFFSSFNNFEHLANINTTWAITRWKSLSKKISAMSSRMNTFYFNLLRFSQVKGFFWELLRSSVSISVHVGSMRTDLFNMNFILFFFVKSLKLNCFTFRFCVNFVFMDLVSVNLDNKYSLYSRSIKKASRISRFRSLF